MASLFKPLILHMEGKQPTSLPLLVYGNHHWNPKTFTLELLEDPSQSPSTDTFHLIPEALELLRSVTKPIAVLSICGPYRTGKSYFLSRLLGTSEIFKVEHTFDACTRGIWMSTTALECEEFVVVFLDTEGMDAIGTSESVVTNLMIVNVLLSSYLIYNSQTVPDWNDLEDLSCFSQLSCSILTQDESKIEDLSKCFPDFLWLVRDQTLQLCTEDGVPLSPTNYLKGSVLVESDNSSPTPNDHVVKAILTLFPSIECFMLPRPSADEDVLTNMIDLEDNLDNNFVSEFEDAKEIIFRKIQPKQALEHYTVNGCLLAELAIQYVDTINNGKCLNLENLFLTAAEKELSDISRRLVEEYQRDMESALSGKLPLEVYSDDPDESKETLLSVHNKVYAEKREVLNTEITRLLPQMITDESIKQSMTDMVGKIISKFDKLIVTFEETSEEPEESSTRQVKEGALLHFVSENYHASRQSCLDSISVKYHQVEEMIQTAFVNKENVDVESKWSLMENEYLEESVGPAKHEVLAQKREDLEKSFEQLKHIPGPPKEVRVVGIARNKIKLVWDGVAYNGDVVDHYKVERQTDSEDWTLLPGEFRESHAIIDDLEAETKYWFRVQAISKPAGKLESICSNPSTVVSEQTRVSALKRGTVTVGGFVAGSIASPIAATIATPYLGPLATVGGLLAAPVAGSMLAYRWYKEQQPCKGDLEADEQSDSSKQKH